MSSIEQRETNPYDILYWLVYKDPYIGLWNNPHISLGIIFHPLYLSQPTRVKWWTHLQLHPGKLTWNLENHLLENQLLLISSNFSPKTSHSCLKEWYFPRFSRLFEKENHLPNPQFWLPNVGFQFPSFLTNQASHWRLHGENIRNLQDSLL